MKYDPSIEIASDPEVYPPSDDSRLLIESLEVRPGEKVLEVGCGSGVVSIHCAKAKCFVTAGDINLRAVELTRRNARRNRVRIDVVETDVYSGVNGRFDTVVFNLPYLPVDEEGLLAKAWSGGPDGLGPLPELLSGSADHLEEGGRIVIVVSSLMEPRALEDILEGWDVSTLGEEKLFFERLSVLEIRPRA
ncbi:MAG: methyltransferase [Thermoplasmata archaeon]|nr:methyltransferase [Thermoplasmata archaeon]